MRLRGRFTLWFTLAALVPIAAAAIGTREVVARNFLDTFRKQREQVQKLAADQLAREQGEVVNTVGQLASPRHPFVGGLLVDLRKGDGEVDFATLRDQREVARAEMARVGLEMLLLVDERDLVLIAPHDRSAHDETDPSRAQRARSMAGQPIYAMESFWAEGEGEPTQKLVLESTAVARDEPHRITVVGGRVVGSAILDMVRKPGSVDARLVDTTGHVLYPSAGKWSDVSAHLFRLPLPGADGAPVAFIEIGLSDRELDRNLRQLTLLAAALAGLVLLAMPLVGVFVARRMTRHLDLLVEGAQAASRGDLDHEVPVTTRDEIGEVADSFNRMMIDLRESKQALVMAERVAAWQEIARRLAHEIKNPLTPIQMAVETLRRTHAKKHPSFDEILEESTSTVLEEAARLKRIVTEFSEFARMPKPDKRRLDVNDIVAAATSLYTGTIDIDKRLAADLPEIEADRDSLQQVLLNLIENARDAIGSRPDGAGTGRIVISTHAARGGKSIVLTIEDNGPGFPPGVKEKLFTPYFTTKHTSGGTGLGLAIVHRIVSDHGGRIAASEAKGGGARFTIELPTPGATPDDLLPSTSGYRPRSRDRRPA